MKENKLEDYKAGEIDEAEASERLEAPELEADPEVKVAKGDEEQPVSGTDHDAAMLTLYAKGRRNRKLMTREDAEKTSDVAMMQHMVDMASGGDVDPDEVAQELDTNRDMDEEERAELARLTAEEEGDPEKPEVAAVEEKEELPEKDEAASLSQIDPDAKVTVKILGREYEVPQQDVDDAGGIEIYQKSRAANVRLQRAATFEQKALKTLEKAARLNEIQPQPDPPDGGPDEADIDSLRDELMDTVIEGTEDDINKWLKAHTGLAAPSTPKPEAPTPAVVTQAIPAPTETQEELARQFNDDRQETNDMMRTTYSDVNDDPELRSLAQQRFQLLITRADSEGRTQKEMARESAEYVRSLGKRILGDKAPPISDLERERRTRIERKRVLPQPSRADTHAPDTREKEKSVPTRGEHIQRLRRHAGQEPPL
jgi:hypothetical protein